MFSKIKVIAPALLAIVGILAMVPGCPPADGEGEGEGE